MRTISRVIAGDRLRFFWLLAAVFAILRWYLFQDSRILIRGWGGDDLLYVSRAYWLHMNGTLGPYHADLLHKVPGFSFLLAGAKAVGLPYLLFLEGLLISTSLYLAYALTTAGLSAFSAALVFAFLLFNPLTLSTLWHVIYREPASFCLFSALFASSLCTLSALKKRSSTIGHAVIFSFIFSFLRLVREEDLSLLWIYVALIAFIGYLSLPQKRVKGIVLLSILPILSSQGVEFGVRRHIEKLYGAPLLHELGEGEYPKLLAVMRSLDASASNSKMLITARALNQTAQIAPETKEAIDNLLAFSDLKERNVTNLEVADRFRIHTFSADRFKNAGEAQVFYRGVRLKLLAACKDQVHCVAPSGGMTPLPHTRFLSSFGEQLFWNATFMFDLPNPLTWGTSGGNTADEKIVNLFKMTVGDATYEATQFSPTVASLGVASLLLCKWVILIGAFLSAYRLLFVTQPLSLIERMVCAIALYFGVRYACLSYVSTFIDISTVRMFFVSFIYFAFLSLVVTLRAVPVLWTWLTHTRLPSRSRLAPALLLFALAPQSATAAHIAFPITSKAAPHLQLLKSPGFLALLIQQSKHPIFQIGSVQFLGPSSAHLTFGQDFPLESMDITYLKDHNLTYDYQGTTRWSLAGRVFEKRFSLSVNASKFEKGLIEADLEADWLTGWLLSRSNETIQAKMQKWFPVDYQDRLFTSLEVSLIKNGQWGPLQNYLPLLATLAKQAQDLDGRTSHRKMYRADYTPSRLIKFTFLASMILSILGLALVMRLYKKLTRG